MGISINNKEIEKLIKDLDGLRTRDIPYIATLTLNNLAFDTKEEISKDIRGHLKFKNKTLKRTFGAAVKVRKATKRKQEAHIEVNKDSWQHKALAHHFYGGDRHRKGLEKALILLGYMDKDEILTPPPGVRIRPWLYVRIIAQLKLVYKAGYAANESEESRERNKKRVKGRFFLIDSYVHSHLSPGIYTRMPDHNKPICILRIAKKPKYHIRLKQFEKRARENYEKRGNKYLNDAIDHALYTNILRGWK